MKRIVATLLSAVLLLGAIFTLSSCKKKAHDDTRYEINAEYMPDTSTVTGTVKITYCNDGEPISLLKFNLWGNAYREDAAFSPVSTTYAATAYYAGKSYGGMEITSVGGSKSWEVVGEDANILCVELTETLYEGDKVTLDIGFSTKLAKVNHRLGKTARTVNLGNFYPILCARKNGGFLECPYYSDGDPFVSACADYKVTFTAPKEYVVACTGEITETRGLESKNAYTVSATNVRDFAVCLSKDYQVATLTTRGTEIKYYYYKDDKSAASLAAIKESFCYFSDAFGAYPYKTYVVAQTGFCLGGMEYPALSMISDRLTEEERLYALVHETAHQWWYAAVGSDQIENAWQDEGLAEYSTALFFDHHESYGIKEEELSAKATENYRAYYDVYGRVFGTADTRMTRHLKEYLSDYEYRSIAYDKGMILFHTLKTGIGEKNFLSALKRYYSACKYKIATPDDMIAAFERVGVDVRGLFESFLTGKAVI